MSHMAFSARVIYAFLREFIAFFAGFVSIGLGGAMCRKAPLLTSVPGSGLHEIAHCAKHRAIPNEN